MPIQLKPPVVQDFQLKKSDDFYGEDKSTKTMISVRQATTGDIATRKDMFANFTRRYDQNDNMEVSQRVAIGELERKEVYLTLAACDLMDEEGKPYFIFKENGRLKSEKDFNEAWGELPLLVSEEFIEIVRSVNEIWATEGEE